MRGVWLTLDRDGRSPVHVPRVKSHRTKPCLLPVAVALLLLPSVARAQSLVPVMVAVLSLPKPAWARFGFEEPENARTAAPNGCRHPNCRYPAAPTPTTTQSGLCTTMATWSDH